MPRYVFLIEYHGGPFCGWQRQRGQPSVQAAIEDALTRLAPGPHRLAVAGRTDAGVHAWGQVATVDLAKEWEASVLADAVNHHLKPHPVAVLQCARVAADFHARFSATGRCYVFRLLSRRAPVTHLAGLVWQVRHGLDAGAMQEAAQVLLGTHDFTTFRASECQARSPVKTLDRLEVTTHETGAGVEYRFHVAARSFLHSQVRSFVGTLERVGAGAWTAADVSAALAARDRAACGPVCPPQGLYLARVMYPEDPF